METDMEALPYPGHDPARHIVEPLEITISPTDGVYTLSAARRAELKPYLPHARTTFLKRLSLPRLGDDNPIRFPHVTLTYAQSLDGQISLSPGVRTQISGTDTKAMTQYLRSQHDAILIGRGTAEADNPGLNSKYSEDGLGIVGLARQPVPIILDPSKNWREDRCPKLFQLAKCGLGRPPWVFQCTDALYNENKDEKVANLDREFLTLEAGGRILNAGSYGRTEDGVDWEAILAELGANGIRSVMIEGGGTIIKDLLRARNQHLIDSLIVTIAPTYLGEGGVSVAPFKTLGNDSNECKLTSVKWFHYDDDIVMAWGSDRLRQEKVLKLTGPVDV